MRSGMASLVMVGTLASTLKRTQVMSLFSLEELSDLCVRTPLALTL